MRSQELVARPQVEQHRETLHRSLGGRARRLLLEQELAELRKGRASHRECMEAVLLVGGQGSVARTLAEHGKARQPAHRHRRQEASRASRAQPTP